MTDLLKLAERFEEGDLTILHNELNSAMGGPFVESEGTADELTNLQTVSMFQDEFLPGNFDIEIKFTPKKAHNE